MKNKNRLWAQLKHNTVFTGPEFTSLFDSLKKGVRYIIGHLLTGYTA